MSKLNNTLSQIAQEVEGASAPLHLWDPQLCGDSGITIDVKGQWLYQGSLIRRSRLITLFAGVLCREDEQYYLKTPVEKLSVNVADAPLLVTSWRLQNVPDCPHPALIITDNVGREFVIGEQHPIVVKQDSQGSLVPYVQLPYAVEAKVTRSVYYQWAEQLAQPHGEGFVIYSAGVSFSLDA